MFKGKIKEGNYYIIKEFGEKQTVCINTLIEYTTINNVWFDNITTGEKQILNSVVNFRRRVVRKLKKEEIAVMCV